MRIAIQGQKGSFHDIVARRFFGEDQDIVCCETFDDLFEAIQKNRADRIVMAVENTLYGSIGANYDLLLKYRYPIIGEEIEHIHQQLITSPGTRLEDIREVYSHPVALTQCREWLEAHLPEAELVEHHDTAGAVLYIKELASPYAAAIAGSYAASLYDMPIAARDIEDEKMNLTRFVILDPHGVPPGDANKASLVLTTSHQPGALYTALGAFEKYSINLTKLESRPIRGERFRYQFFVDAECDSQQLSAVTSELAELECECTVLGHYRCQQ